MSDELIRMTASEAVRRLKAKEITPLDLIDAAEKRIAACEGALNALPTLCLDRAREHLATCGCQTGCPSCVGPAYALGPEVREAVAHLLTLA